MSHNRLLAAGVLVLALSSPATAREVRQLELDGELYARDSLALMPPTIDGLWQLNISLLAPDGTPVKQGQPVLGFDATQLDNQLREKRSQLEQKRREREKQTLELVEREKNEAVILAQARADLDKAMRKASQPAGLLAAIEYQKLVIDRELAEQAMVLAERKHVLAAAQRREERRVLQAEHDQLERDVKRIEQGITAMTQVAPRDGVLQHKSGWNGDKFEVGSQVWRGLAVAELPDPASMAVRAHLPETDYIRLDEGEKVEVRVEGSGLVLPGRVEAVGKTVTSKSKLQPVPVIEVIVTLDPEALGKRAAKLKPGQAVRVLRQASSGGQE